MFQRAIRHARRPATQRLIGSIKPQPLQITPTTKTPQHFTKAPFHSTTLYTNRPSSVLNQVPRRRFTSEITPTPQQTQPPQQQIPKPTITEPKPLNTGPKPLNTGPKPTITEPKPQTQTSEAPIKNQEGQPQPPTTKNQERVNKTPESTTETRAGYLDRRDNIHSYERGQFQVDTGQKLEQKNINWLYYLTSIGFASLGMSFVAVPLYQAFCQMTGAGGQLRRDQQIDELNRYMQRTQAVGDITLRPIQVTFQSTVDVNLDWSFYPCQKDITLRIGETALAFFRARNNGPKPVIGVSTYNVLPPQAGLYFNKIQCFCFDEQRLRSGEEIDMPVFFFLDPAMADDWRMDNVDQVTLCYTFFEVQEDEVEEAVKELNQVRSQNNERIASSQYNTLLTQSKPVISEDGTTTTVDNRDGTKTISQTFTVNVPTTTLSQNNNTHNKNQHEHGDDEEALICPIIPPTAMHNPSGISLMQSQLPRIVTDAEAQANQAKIM